MSDYRSLILLADWTKDANCVGSNAELFFPQRGESTAPARAVCRACDVQAECLAYALTNGEQYGIWGGTSERQRRTMRRTINGTPAARPVVDPSAAKSRLVECPTCGITVRISGYGSHMAMHRRTMQRAG